VCPTNAPRAIEWDLPPLCVWMIQKSVYVSLYINWELTRWMISCGSDYGCDGSYVDFVWKKQRQMKWVCQVPRPRSVLLPIYDFLRDSCARRARCPATSRDSTSHRLSVLITMSQGGMPSRELAVIEIIENELKVSSVECGNWGWSDECLPCRRDPRKNVCKAVPGMETWNQVPILIV